MSQNSATVKIQLRSELRDYEIEPLRKRAITEGVLARAVKQKEGGENESSELIELIISQHLELGPSAQLVAVLKTGGRDAVGMVAALLDHAVELLEAQTSVTPRKARKEVRELIQRVESIAATIDAEWADGVSTCRQEDLDRFGAMLMLVGRTHASSACASRTAVGVYRTLRERECAVDGSAGWQF
eukprot:SAG11_NODE_24_length_24699_cov_10.132195_12_plen_186_part_00